MVFGVRTININENQTLQDIVSPGQLMGLFLSLLKWIKTQMYGQFGVYEMSAVSYFHLH